VRVSIISRTADISEVSAGYDGVGKSANRPNGKVRERAVANQHYDTERYLQLLESSKVKGTKFVQQNYITKRDEEIDLEAKVHPLNKIQKLREDPKAARPS
jgi:hypothetical protein